MRQEALATEASRPGPPGTDRRAWGIATHGAAPPLPVENVADQPDAESRRVARVIVQLTHALEADRAAQPSSRLAAITPDQRGRVPVVITRLDRVRTTWQDSYYFEAQKDYGRIRAFAGGWALSSAAGFSLVQVDAGVEGASGETTRRRGHVLGALQVGPAVVWVVEMRGYEGSSYALADVGLPPTDPQRARRRMLRRTPESFREADTDVRRGRPRRRSLPIRLPRGRKGHLPT